MQAAINEQINFEMFSANTYLSMSAYFAQQGLDGFAHWYYMQYKEELAHAEDMMHYVITRGGKVEIKAVAAVETEFNSPLEITEKAYHHECLVSEKIEGLDEAHLTGDRTGAVGDAAVAEDEDLLIALATLLEEEVPHASILHHQRLTARRYALDVAGEELIHRLVLDDLGPRLTLPITEVHLLQAVIEGGEAVATEFGELAGAL